MPYSEWTSRTAHPASRSITRSTSTNGMARSSASILPRVDLPAPRRPISATRPVRDGSGGPAPNSSVSARRARASAASSRPRSRRSICDHSGDAEMSSPTSSAIEHCNAPASCRSSMTEALPCPVSRFARCRSEMPAACASALRVMPRRARSARTRSPRLDRNGSLPGPVAGAWAFRFMRACGTSAASCILLLDNVNSIALR